MMQVENSNISASWGSVDKQIEAFLHFNGVLAGLGHKYANSLPSKSVNLNQPFPEQALVFMCLQYKSFWKHWEKEKLLVTSNFSFSHSVFYLSGELPDVFINFKIVDCKFFELGSV